jgi:hypothetical protein
MWTLRTARRSPVAQTRPEPRTGQREGKPCVTSPQPLCVTCARPNGNLWLPCGNSVTTVLNRSRSDAENSCCNRARPPSEASSSAATTPNRPKDLSGDFESKEETAQQLRFVRSVDAGEIRVLEVRGGLPFRMEIAE